MQAGLAALKAIFINRIGDIGLLLAISLIIGLFKTLDFTILGVLVPLVSESYPIFSFGAIGLNIFFIDAICSFLLLGVVGKSAQFGLHT